ncbi:hypothetical protein, partial [Streptomyces sp. WM6386]|uniref:hypothetical protein n=1 Tax=Streptomyces sp. WM6386 TaxID=1415558 RepID=UPI001F44E182
MVKDEAAQHFLAGEYGADPAMVPVHGPGRAAGVLCGLHQGRGICFAPSRGVFVPAEGREEAAVRCMDGDNSPVQECGDGGGHVRDVAAAQHQVGGAGGGLR